MIRVEFFQDIERGNLIDEYVIFCLVDLASKSVRIEGGTVKRAASPLPAYPLSPSELLDALGQNGTTELDIKATAIAEASLSAAACTHCGSAEAAKPGVCCLRCRAVHSELPPGQAEAIAGELLEALRRLRDSYPQFAAKVAGPIENAEALVEHLAVLNTRSERESEAAE